MRRAARKRGGSTSFIPGHMWKGRGRLQLSLGEACQSLQLLGLLVMWWLPHCWAQARGGGGKDVIRRIPASGQTGFPVTFNSVMQ